MKYQQPKFNKYGLTQWYWIARHRENLKLGANTQIGAFTVLDCDHGMEIGDNVKIGYNCSIFTHSSVDGKSGPIKLADNCKIGANSVIMPGLTIGENATVGANSFVKNSIPTNEIWAGSPARLIGRNLAIQKMRILHAPIEIAGEAAIISRAQRKLGYQSDVLVKVNSPYDYPYDICLDLNRRQNSLFKTGKLLYHFFRAIFKYDVFHFHCGMSFLPKNYDLWILKFFGKKVVMEYWGSDVIQTDVALDYTSWTKQDLAEIYPKIDNHTKRKKLAQISRWVGKTVVGDYSLSPYSKKSIVVRQAIDLDNLPFVGTQPKGKITIVHAPTHRKIKGTKYVLEAIERLKREKYRFNFILVEKKPRTEALEIYQKADIIVDSLLQGHYGILALECMALGKPVLCHIHPKLKKFYSDAPIINSTSETIYQDLRHLIENPKKLTKIGLEGRKYVEKHHDSILIAKKLLAVYEKL